MSSISGAAEMRVYPADRRGLRVPSAVLRPLSQGDTDTVHRIFAGMSAESRRMRFLAPLPRLSEQALTRLADVDHDGHGCWVATVGDAPVGLGRYVRLPREPRIAEVALEVIDELQGRGLGTLLLAAVAVAAADTGIRSLLWVMDPANVRVRRLMAPLEARFSVQSGVLEARTGLPTVSGLDAEQVVRLARAARQAAAEASAQWQDVA